jgi:hypothetical protein
MGGWTDDIPKPVSYAPIPANQEICCGRVHRKISFSTGRKAQGDPVRCAKNHETNSSQQSLPQLRFSDAVPF